MGASSIEEVEDAEDEVEGAKLRPIVVEIDVDLARDLLRNAIADAVDDPVLENVDSVGEGRTVREERDWMDRRGWEGGSGGRVENVGIEEVEWCSAWSLRVVEGNDGCC